MYKRQGKQSAKHAVSDWMDIEKQGGISVTSSVLQFNYAGKCVNILDTPGHQDFSEDVYKRQDQDLAGGVQSGIQVLQKQLFGPGIRVQGQVQHLSLIHI